MTASTIAAIATPPGSGGIGIIKISGKRSLEIAAALFRKSKAGGPAQSAKNDVVKNPGFLSHRLYHGHIVDPRNGNVVDEVLLSWMRAPHSYTGEDVVEINSHSGTLLMQHVLNLVLQQGAELAGPGEFSKRAFLNGRMDLTRAEAVNDLICAESASALKIAAAQLSGKLGERIQRMRSVLISLLSDVYASLDFGDEIEGPENRTAAAARLQAEVLNPLAKLVQDHHELGYLRSGIDIVIAGAPNVGKSTLMNRLAGGDRCIVSAQPGTTRDVIEQRIIIKGLSVRLSDTAGLHESSDPVETIGVAKAWQKLPGADLVLILIDASRELNDWDVRLFERITACGARALLVVNKIDIETPPFRKSLRGLENSLPRVEISARNGQHIELLEEEIVGQVTDGRIPDASQKIVPGLRHKHILEKTRGACQDALRGMQNQEWTEIIAADLEAALRNLGEITGEHYNEEAIEALFSRFCIGK